MKDADIWSFCLVLFSFLGSELDIRRKVRMENEGVIMDYKKDSESDSDSDKREKFK